MSVSASRAASGTFSLAPVPCMEPTTRTTLNPRMPSAAGVRARSLAAALARCAATGAGRRASRTPRDAADRRNQNSGQSSSCLPELESRIERPHDARSSGCRKLDLRALIGRRRWSGHLDSGGRHAVRRDDAGHDREPEGRPPARAGATRGWNGAAPPGPPRARPGAFARFLTRVAAPARAGRDRRREGGG